MNGYSEIRRVRSAMSTAAGHDVRRLIATINKRKAAFADRIIDPGTAAESCSAPEPSKGPSDRSGQTPRATGARK